MVFLVLVTVFDDFVIVLVAALNLGNPFKSKYFLDLGNLLAYERFIH